VGVEAVRVVVEAVRLGAAAAAAAAAVVSVDAAKTPTS